MNRRTLPLLAAVVAAAALVAGCSSEKAAPSTTAATATTTTSRPKCASPEQGVPLKSTIVDKGTDMALGPLEHDKGFNRDRAAALARLFSEKMRAMTPAEFQDLLRPAFQEDEWILLVLGFVTGFAAGMVQLMLGFQ